MLWRSKLAEEPSSPRSSVLALLANSKKSTRLKTDAANALAHSTTLVVPLPEADETDSSLSGSSKNSKTNKGKGVSCSDSPPPAKIVHRMYHTRQTAGVLTTPIEIEDEPLPIPSDIRSFGRHLFPTKNEKL